MLQLERKGHKEREMLGNVDLLGVTWSFVPVPKVSFWLLPEVTVIQAFTKSLPFSCHLHLGNMRVTVFQ